MTTVVTVNSGNRACYQRELAVHSSTQLHTTIVVIVIICSNTCTITDLDLQVILTHANQMTDTCQMNYSTLLVYSERLHLQP